MRPMLAPAVGSFICGFTGFALDMLWLHETYARVLLTKEAIALHHTAGGWSLQARHEEIVLDRRTLLVIYLARPLRLLFTEPLIALSSIYLAFIYGLM